MIKARERERERDRPLCRKYAIVRVSLLRAAEVQYGRQSATNKFVISTGMFSSGILRSVER